MSESLHNEVIAAITAINARHKIVIHKIECHWLSAVSVDAPDAMPVCSSVRIDASTTSTHPNHD